MSALRAISLPWQLAAWLAGLWICWLGLQGMVAEWQPDLAFLEFGWLLLAPAVWKLEAVLRPDPPATPAVASRETGWARLDVAAMVLIAATSLTISLATAAWFDDLPPAYHDEYSYLFQAESMLHGRWTWPGSSQFPELFDQYHVLNEGRMASRYYPGTGFWLAPWVWLGHPWWGQWCASALSAVLLYAIGRELQGRWTGLIAGFSLAMSPGLALFGNLLLAHQATLLALMLFLWGFVRGVRTGRLRDFLISGFGLGFALLCRPATAAGFGLPFGVWCLGLTVQAVWQRRQHLSRTGPVDGAAVTATDALVGKVRAVWPGYGIPLLIAIGIAVSYNAVVTGNWRVSPYQRYTDVYTPRHVYGLNNVVRGEQHLGPKVLDEYDRWAENLTPELANLNTRNRLLISGLWTIGLPLLVMTAVLSLPLLWSTDHRWQCVAWAIMTLHAIHWPYWYVGIMGWHYVFETAPLWCLLLGWCGGRLQAAWRARGHSWMNYWFPGLMLLAWSGMYLSIGDDWQARWSRGVQSILYPRQQHALFRQWIASEVGPQPALILIDQTASNPHLDLIINEPGLNAPILYGRYRPGITDLAGVVAAFPDRRVLIVEPETHVIRAAADVLATSG